MPTHPDKVVLRSALIAARKALSAEIKTQSDLRIMSGLQALLEAHQIRVLGAYLPMPGEPDLTPLYAELLRREIHIAMPVVIEKNQALIYVSWQPGDALSKDASGTLAPARRDVALSPELILAPCVGFTESRLRLGYGGGYFDRTLARQPKPLAAGIAYACTCTHFAAASHDVPLDWILTEEKLI